MAPDFLRLAELVFRGLLLSSRLAVDHLSVLSGVAVVGYAHPLTRRVRGDPHGHCRLGAAAVSSCREATEMGGRKLRAVGGIARLARQAKFQDLSYVYTMFRELRYPQRIALFTKL